MVVVVNALIATMGISGYLNLTITVVSMVSVAMIMGLGIDFGISGIVIDDLKINYQEYGKLIPCDTSAVKDFIHWASIEKGIYSLGRWGTHRQLLMDDVVSDIKVIDRLIRSRGYSR